MNVVAKRKRFTDEPVINPNTGEPIIAEIQDDDVRLFHALAFHYHYLSPEYIAPLLGRSYDPIARRTRLLRLPPNNYLRLAPEQQNNKRHHYWGHLFYAVDKKGLAVLCEHGHEPPHRTAPALLKHQVMVDQIMASIEIGVNADRRLEIVWWEQLIESGRIAKDTKPYMTLGMDAKGNPITAHPDRFPFALKREFSPPSPMFFLGYEADTGTQSFTVIRDKFSSYIEAIERGLPKSLFNANTSYISFLTPRPQRKDRMKSILAEMTAHRPSLRRWFLFKTHPLYTAEDKPRATGHMVTEPFERIGYPPVSLNRPLSNEPIKEG